MGPSWVHLPQTGLGDCLSAVLHAEDNERPSFCEQWRVLGEMQRIYTDQSASIEQLEAIVVFRIWARKLSTGMV